MPTEKSFGVSSFSISMLTIKDIGGNTPRIGEDFPWADNMPALFGVIEQITRHKIILMGPSTWKALEKNKMSKRKILSTNNRLYFVFTKSKMIKVYSKIPVPIFFISSLEKIEEIWSGNAKLEKYKDKKQEEKIKELIKKYGDGLCFRADNKIKPEIVVFGGGKLYQTMLSYANVIHTLLIYDSLPGDVVLPIPNKKEWSIVSGTKEYNKNKENECDFLYSVWGRKISTQKLLRIS